MGGNILWIGLLIPALLAGVLLAIPSLRRKTVYWELVIPAVITVITIFICQYVAVRNAINDKEYWGHIAIKVIHEEPFAYDSECQESYACGTETYSCGTSKNPRTCSRTKYCTRWVHCVRNSSRTCYLIDDRNQKYRISYGKYNEITKKFKMFKYGSDKIITNSHGYKTIGDKYKRNGHGNKHWVYWNWEWDTSEPIVVEHTYENRLQTQSHWASVSEEDIIAYDLHRYPIVSGGWEATTILTNGPKFKKSDKYLRYLNGYLNTNNAGYKKVRLWVLVYNNQPQMAAEYQRDYWKGGNKNEFIIMLGTNPEKEVTWVDIMTQCESDLFTIEVRDHLKLEFAEGKNGYSGKLTDNDLLSFSKWLGEKAKKGYVKPDFKQYDYIQVQPSLTALLISFGIIVFVNIGMGFFIVYNPWDENSKRNRYNRW